MIKEIKMPAGGQTTDTSKVGAWLVKSGDKVKRGDALLEIETDKATLTVESFAQGVVLAIVVKAGDMASAGDVLAYIGEESDRPEVEKRLLAGGAAPQSEEYQPIDRPASVEKRKEAVKAMPNAKALASEQGVSLCEIAERTGKNVLKKQDIQNYIQSTNGSKKKEDIKIPLTGMRKIIGSRMLESSQSIPAFQATVAVNMEQCVALRKQMNRERGERKISYNDILFKCIEAAIRQYPYINASYAEEAIVLHRDVNIGLAVAVDGGLVVPVVKEVNGKNIEAISDANRENVKKARGGNLVPAEMSGGTITLSNMGMYPVTQFQAIINPPEVCILAVGVMEERPVYTEGVWNTVPFINITGTFDHRVMDGAYGAQFLTELKRIVENPALALL